MRSKAADGSVTETETKRVHTYGKAWALQVCLGCAASALVLAATQHTPIHSWLGVQCIRAASFHPCACRESPVSLPPCCPPQPDDYEAVMFKRPFLAGVRNLLPSWLGGPRKKQAS